MSELKTRYITDTYLDYFKSGKHDLAQIYLKSEADKVIADKDKTIAELIQKNERLANKDLIMASETIKGVFNELNQQKYKRCLDKAKWCKDKIDAIKNGYIVCGIMTTCPPECNPKISFYKKWHTRWLKTAEKFKEEN